MQRVYRGPYLPRPPPPFYTSGAQAAERLDWNDVVDCARFCQEAFAQSAA